MKIVSVSQFYVYTYRGLNAGLAQFLISVLNVKALVHSFNQEKALVGASSVIMNLRVDLRLQLQHQVSPGEGRVTQVTS